MARSSTLRRVVSADAQRAMSRTRLQRPVRELEALVDRQVPVDRVLGGSVEYVQSKEDRSDWAVVVATRLDLAQKDTFDLSLRIGEALNALADDSPEGDWLHVSYRLDNV